MILVDGGSVDDTVEAARRLLPDIRVVTQNRRGKGNALASGFAAVTGDIIVMFDADGSADPTEIPRVRRGPGRRARTSPRAPGSGRGGGSADITPVRRARQPVPQHAGERLVPDPVHRPLLRLQRVLGRPDPAARPARPELVAPAGAAMLWGDGFEIETLINCRFARAGLRIAEVPSFEQRAASTARAT